MSLNLGVMSAAVTLDDKEYRNKLNGLQDASESTFKRIAVLAAGYFSLRAIGNFASAAINTFSDLQEETNKFNVVFQNMGTKTSRVLNEMRRDFGLSELAAKKMLAGTGDILTGLDFDRETALALSEGAAKLGADVASFSNYAGGAAGATDALTKAMLNVFEPAKALGIVIRQEDEDFKTLTKQAMTTGVTIDALGRTFVVQSEKQAKAVAALAMAYKQSPNAIGDFVRSQDSIANQTRILQNNFEQLYATVGGDMSGSYQNALLFSNSLLKSYNELSPATRQLTNDTALLAAMLALASKTGVISGANKTFGSIGNLSGIKEQTEADAVAATEQLKRVEYAKTDAILEAYSQKQSLRTARQAVQEQEAAVASAKAQIVAAQASGDATQILTAKKQLATATQNLTKAQLAESTATQQLTVKQAAARTASIQYTVAKKAETLATDLNAKASTAAGRAHLALTASMKTAKTAAAGLYAALGPVGIAMIALSAGYLAYNYLTEKNRNELEGQINLTHKNVEAANELATAHAKERGENTARMERLQELAKYERLNNSEKTEAERLIGILTKKYGDLGIQINGTTGKLNLQADAWDRINKAKAKEASDDLSKKVRAQTAQNDALMNGLRDELGSTFSKSGFNQYFTSAAESILSTVTSSDRYAGAADKLRSTDLQLQLDSIQKLNTVEEKITELEKLRNTLAGKNDKKRADAIETVIKNLRVEQEQRKQLDDINQARKKHRDLGAPLPGELGTSQDNKAREQSDKERRAMESLEDREWNILLDTASAEEQINILDAKIKKVFKKQSGKYAELKEFKDASRNPMTEQELKDLQEIIELEGKREQIRKRSAEAFLSEHEAYEQYLNDLNKKQQDQALERKIKQAQKSGDKTGADAIMQRELEKARDAAKIMQRQYEQALRAAEADGVLTEKEKKRVQELKRQMQQALSDEDKWANRVANETDKDNRNRQTTVAWSSEILSAQLGGAMKPQEEVARHTRRTVDLLRDIKNNLKSTGTEILA